MRSKPNPSEWKQLDLDNQFAAGQAYQRFVWLAEYDPFIALFGRETITNLGNLFFSESCLGSDKIYTKSVNSIRAHVNQALLRSPMARLLSDEFKSHIIGLVQTAVLAGKE